MNLKVVAVDFDGVICHYTHWKGLGVFGPVLPGCVDELTKMKKIGYTIIIWTTRGDDLGNVEAFLRKNKVPYDYINRNTLNAPSNISKHKILADVYLDDRAMPFDGVWEGIADKVSKFQPWWYRRQKSEEG